MPTSHTPIGSKEIQND